MSEPENRILYMHVRTWRMGVIQTHLMSEELASAMKPRLTAPHRGRILLPDRAPIAS